MRRSALILQRSNVSVQIQVRIVNDSNALSWLHSVYYEVFKCRLWPVVKGFLGTGYHRQLPHGLQQTMAL